MFVARDQENLVHGHQQLAASKPLNHGTKGLHPKTPGTKYPKTPLKIPLNDENAGGGIKGKSNGLENIVLGGKKATFDKSAFVTPVGPRVRAPLGAKTTNAKAKAFQTPLGNAPLKEVEKTQPQASTRKPKRVIHADTVKVEVFGDESPLRLDREVEYCPPKPQDLPYESEDFPVGCLNYEPLKPENLTKGIWRAYHKKEVDADGLTEEDRRWQAENEERNKKVDEAILKSLEEDWLVGDVPETFAFRQKKSVPSQTNLKASTRPSSSTLKAPPTVTSRKAVSALGLSSKPKALPITSKILAKPKPSLQFLSRAAPVSSITAEQPSTMRHNAAVAASRSTIGYSKGRSASGGVPSQRRQGGMTRSVSNVSAISDVTITPARFAQHEDREAKRLPWLVAFEADDENVEPLLKGGSSENLRKFDEDEEEFVMTLG